ncbi:Uncharacterized conserved protein, cupin superfamily [Modicisalibacter muralis]|uniref:Uncharacterized conserved protein, cupin superfamily n=1 Tax=Modicisalibacter muralis TaxID=119000 RepID=A0A1G9S118_9GAMM|nr:cupin domain-containing protein [Halomonas muralis]SDM29248.1 Uncharacterized conserved protein, cupin superfamily [Halomonas muralis]
MSPVISLSQLILEHWRQGSRYASADTSFAGQLGLSDIGASYNEVPAGKSGCPFHNHQVVEEMFLILEGEGEYRFGEATYPVKAGDVLGAPAGGAQTAHQLLNTGTGPLKYLGISSVARGEVVEYPDSGKFLVSSHTPDGRRTRFVGRSTDEVDYWDDEPGA